MTYSVTKAIQDIENTIENLTNPDSRARSEAAAWAQYAFCGYPNKEKAERLIEAVGRKLELRVNGHAEPLEPDKYVRERCADTLRLASEAGFNISRFLPSLQLTAERDPVDWVRERAQDALSVLKAPKEDPLPLPKAWSTRPAPAAPAAERKVEKQIRA